MEFLCGVHVGADDVGLLAGIGWQVEITAGSGRGPWSRGMRLKSPPDRSLQ